MDQPTSIELRIVGNEQDVKRAALSAMARINQDTNGFVESDYSFGDGSDFEKQMSNILDLAGSFNIHQKNDGQIEFESEQESYGCVYEEDIREIANAMISVSPNIEFHIEAVITIYADEGYDLCVDVNYINGKCKVKVTEEEYDDFDNEDYDEEEDE